MDSLRAAWQARSPRERSVLMLGALALAVMLFYTFAWEPMQAERKRLREQLPQMRAAAEQFNLDATEAARLRAAAQTMHAAARGRTAVEEVADRMSVRASITSVNEMGEGRLRIAMAAVPYSAFVQWLGALAKDAAIAVETVELSPGSAPGTVVIETLQLKGNGGS